MLLEDGAPVAERRWEESRAANQEVFRVLREVVGGLALPVSAIDLFAVSSGPGSFSGLRMALAAARAMALPGGRPVCGVSSGEVLARDVLRAAPAATVAVLGDARRGAWWLGQFRGDARGMPCPLGEYRLVAPEALAQAIAPDAVVVTPDWGRIGPALEQAAPAPAQVVRAARRPSARTLAELALARAASGGEIPAPQLLYLHPAVAARAS